MKNAGMTIWLMVAVVLVMGYGVQAVTHFNDGGTWAIDYEIDNSVHIDEGNAYAGRKTTVDIVQGGSIPLGRWPNFNYFRAYNQSTATVSGGSVGQLHAYHFSTVNISGGEITGDWRKGLHAHNYSTVNISGGEITSWQGFYAYNYSTVNIDGGWIYFLGARDFSTVNIDGGSVVYLGPENLRFNSQNRININGGTVEMLGAGIDVIGNEHFSLTADLTLSDLADYGVQAVDGTVDNVRFSSICAYDTSSVEIAGSSVYRLHTYDTSTVNITGGSVGEIRANKDSTVNISGGLIEVIWASDSWYGPNFPTISIIGKNFELGDGLWLDGDELMGTGMLSGQWLDGTEWTTEIYINHENSTILLIPVSFSLVDFAILASHWQKSDCIEPDWCDGADLHKSGTVDFHDLVIFAENWLLEYSQ